MVEAQIPVGIDLGTTNSCVAYWDKNSKMAKIITNTEGHTTTPSYIAWKETTQNPDGEIVYGSTALNQAQKNPSNTVYDAKRLIGRQFEDPEVQQDMKNWPFQVKEDDQGKPLICVKVGGNEKSYKPEQISSMILQKLKERAEKVLMQPVNDVVITVPAYFNNNQKQATEHAGKIAGLNVKRIINEPTAAALAFGIDQQKDSSKGSNTLIFDLGGGTFDVSIINMQDGIFEVRSHGGDTHLGGEDFNNELVQHSIKEFLKTDEIDINAMKPDKKNKVIRRLWTACENAKKTLSTAFEFDLTINVGDDDPSFVITRNKFEELIEKHTKKLIPIVEKTLEESKMTKDKVDNIVLVGGSTRIPIVQKILENFFEGKQLDHSVHPDEAVAMGAAILSMQICAPKAGLKEIGLDTTLLIDVTPLDLGLEVQGGEMNVLIKKGTAIPFKAKQMYTNARDYQELIEFRVYQGDQKYVRDCTEIGSFDLKGFKSVQKMTAVVEVTFQLDTGGLITITAVDKTNGADQATQITVESKTGLTQEELEKMKAEQAQTSDNGKNTPASLSAKDQFENFLFGLKQFYEQKKEQMNGVQKVQFDTQIKTANQWLDNHQDATAQEYQNKKTELEAQVQPIKDKYI